MRTEPFSLYMMDRGLFPALAVVVLLLFWGVGVFRRGYLEAGPRRRLRFSPTARGVLLVIALASPWAGSLPGAAVFVVMLAAWPGAMRVFGVAGGGVFRSIGWGLLVGVLAALLAFGANMTAANLGLVLGDAPDAVAHDMLRELVQAPTFTGVVRLVLFAVVLAPLLEEACYRGMAQTLLGDGLRRGRRWAIVLGVSLVFALAHVPVVSWHALPGLFVLGVVFGALYERTGSLWAPMTAHALFNAGNIAIALAISS